MTAMYLPAHFTEDRISVLHKAIREIGFGTLVTVNAGEIEASHLPMLLDESKGRFGTLSGHMARANPQWRSVSPDVQALAMFAGPNAYISPSWYPSKQETGKVVPTWNYIAVHCYGQITFYDDRSELRDHVSRLTSAHESSRPAPWSVSDAPEDYIESMLRGIVGFRLTITKLQGKWKLSQNRLANDIAGASEGLSAAGGDVRRSVADLMKAAQFHADTSE